MYIEQERWRQGKFRETRREQRRKKDSGILVNVSTLCIARCAIHFSDLLCGVTDEIEDEKEGCRR